MKIEMKKAYLLALTLLLPLWAGTEGLMAQTNAEIYAGIQYNFATPGARSLGLGGAFIGLADDATAAFTNPAGLTILLKPEISLEGRHSEFSTTFTGRGHAFGPARNQGYDTVEGLTFDETESDSTEAAFLSFVYPMKSWSFAIFRHQMASFGATMENPGTYFSMGRISPFNASLNLDIVSFGVAAAYQISDNFSVGISTSFYDFELQSETTRYRFSNLLAPPDFSQESVAQVQSQTGDDEDTGVQVGVLWKPTAKLSIGGVYRQGPEFGFRSFIDQNQDRDPPPPSPDPGPASDPPPPRCADIRGKFNVPDVYGLGFAFSPTDAWRITFDIDRIEYSELTSETIDVLFAAENNSQLAREVRRAKDRLTVDDVLEIHLGLEYLVTQSKFPIALRAGAWLDPDHKIRFDGMPERNFPSEAFSGLFRPGDDEIHYSFGFGVAFGNFQLDAGVDISDPLNVVSLSGVIGFGK